MVDIFKHLVQDTLTGTLWRSERQLVLVAGEEGLLLRGKVVAQGNLWLRYAIRYHGPRHLAVVPAVFVSEQGGMLYGDKAWRFIFKNYQLYPRAEIVGLRSDGDEVQVFMRELDLADSARILVYDSPEKTLPLGFVDRIIAGASTVVPARASALLAIERKE